MRTTRPTVSYDYAVLDGVCGQSALWASLEVDAIQPVRGHCTQHSHDEIQSYVIYGLHVCMYTVQILWLFWSEQGGW